jgi:hypothetical protein
MTHDRPRVQSQVRERPEVIRYALGILLTFAALNAFGGGYYGMRGAKGIPTEWLLGSPFHSYFVPSLFLFVVVGGSFLVAAVAVHARWALAWVAAVAAGVIVLGWIAVQLAVIGCVSWMQPLVAVAGVVILRLGLVLGRQ